MSLRIRSIHGGQWKDAEFLSCSPLARLLAIGLRNLSDDGGVFEWKPKTIKLELLPADNCEISDLLAELVDNRQVIPFNAGGKRYGYIRNFGKYQRPRNPKYLYPAAPLAADDSANLQHDGKLSEAECHQSVTSKPAKLDANSPNGDIGLADVGCRREEEKTEAIASAKKTIDFVDEEIRAFIEGNKLVVNPEAELPRFKDWQKSRGRRFRDERAAFRNWLRKAADIARERATVAAKKPAPIMVYAEPWEQRLRAFRASGRWDEGHFGPRPGEPGCRVPAELLRGTAA